MEPSLPEVRRQEDNLLNLFRHREISESTARLLPHKLHVTKNLISRLGLEKELEGHKGCVNCLEWNETGEILASASDDMHLILWDPFRYEKKLILHTGHNGNIFSVKFMPKSNNTILVTGAGDNGIRVHDISLSDTILVCTCHTGRVKRIATLDNVPFLFWSAAEDGLILQYDMRMQHNCTSSDRKNVLVDLVNHAGRKAEAKCMAVCAARPELVAIGANDPYVRIYDRRMIKLSQIPIESPMQNGWVRFNSSTAGKGDPGKNIPLGCAQYFIAGHLRPGQGKDSTRNFATTYLTFSTDGREILVNMGGEQIYLFDIDKHKNNKMFQCDSPNRQTSELEHSESQNDDARIRSSAYGTNDYYVNKMSSFKSTALPQHVEDIKQEANRKFEQQHYNYAINLYNKALSLCPFGAVLYANRAATFMKRRWDGDTYSALRDCQITLLLDPEHIKAHFRLARCLYDLGRPTEAYRVIEDFQCKFPSYTSNLSHKSLRKDITEAMNADTSRSDVYSTQISPYEVKWRENTIDYNLRFCGHCNTTTDIKEVNFFGDDQYVLAGSDDGSFFIWDRDTTNIVRVLRGDERIVNCLQPHPSTCLLATSGIDPVIRLWSPLPEDGKINDREIENLHEAASANQIRMNSDPFELMMMSMGYRLPGPYVVDDEDEPHDLSALQPANCRTS